MDGRMAGWMDGWTDGCEANGREGSSHTKAAHRRRRQTARLRAPACRSAAQALRCIGADLLAIGAISVGNVMWKGSFPGFGPLKGNHQLDGL